VGKYDPLRDELMRRRAPRVVLPFAKIERLVGPLPAAAYHFEWWWSNVADGDQDYPQSRAWRSAGYSVDVSLSWKTALFIRQLWPRRSA